MPPATLRSDDILFHDDHLLVLNKPAGVPVHGSRMLEGRPTTLLALARELTGRMVHAAHRLDRPVSGAIVLAFDRETLAALSRAFEERQVTKRYLGVVRGWTDTGGAIDYPLKPPRDERRGEDEARPALTLYERLATMELPEPVPPYATARYSLLSISPETGRRHQIRRHLKHVSHHLAGDTTYGRGEHNRVFRKQFGCERLLLHSRTLGFRHPVSGERIERTAPLDPVFSRVVERFGQEG
jgi:tRNA pseudouridine65 synthase